jgi:hypothetical protein
MGIRKLTNYNSRGQNDEKQCHLAIRF